MTSIALRSLWARRLRTALTSISIVLGVMMVAGTYVLTDTIDAAFNDIFVETNEGIDAVVTSKEVVETDDGQEPSFDASVLDLVLATGGVATAAGAITDPQVALIGSDGDRIGSPGAPSLGVSDGPEEFDPLDYISGAKPATAGEVAIDKGSADREKLSVGDQIAVSGRGKSAEYEISGIVTIGDAESLGGASLAVFTLPEAQTVTGKEGKFDQISVSAEDGVSPERLVATLTDNLPEGIEAKTGAQNIASQQADIGELIGFLKTALLIFSGVSLFVASFLIFNTFSITVAQRTREFATLRTIGASRRQIVLTVVLEAFVVGVLASVTGLLLGIGFASVIRSLLEALEIDLPSQGSVVATRTIIIALVLGTLVTLISALAPALRATRIPPIAGLREGALIETRRDRRRRETLAVLLLAAGIVVMLFGLFGALSPGEAWIGFGAVGVFVGVAILSPRLVRPLASLAGTPLERVRGVPGRLARENAVRNPGRTAATAAALMIGLALVSFVAIFAAGLRGSIDSAIDKTIAGDLILSNDDGFSDIPLAAAGAVAVLDGVEVASPLRFTKYRLSPTEDGYLTLIDPVTAESMLSLDWTEGEQSLIGDLGPGEILIDEGFADEQDVGAGEVLMITAASAKELDLTVRGAFTDTADFAGDFYASDAIAAEFDEEENATNVLIGISETADSGAVRAEIETALDEFPTARVQDQQEFKDSIGDQINQLLGVIYALLALAVIVSLFGIVNTLALTIFERTRELGLLRAVGTSRRQVRQIVRYEAVITALIGAILGAVLGVVFAVIVSRPLADDGFTLSFPIGTLIGLLVLAMLAGVVAAIGPARRAAGIDVLEAVGYE